MQDFSKQCRRPASISGTPHCPRRRRAPGDGILLVGCCLVLAFCAGCASEVFAPDVAPEYIVIRDFSPCYRLGPQQARGADVSISAQTRVKLLRREMGFSLVLLEDGRTGYVANEDMVVAPPRPPAAPEKPAISDSPFPEDDLPSIDWNIPVVPASLPTAPPEEAPKPRD